jgi:DNA-binding transcriptional MerR regulator
MAKSAEAFRTISEVADELNVQKHVLRFWETRFPQLRPMKRGGGRRYYRPEDLRLLRGIQYLLHDQGYQIKGVQRILRTQGVEHVKLCVEEAGAAPELVRPDGAAAVAAKQIRKQTAANAKAKRGKLNGEAQKVLKSAIANLEACRGLLIGDQASVPSSSGRAAKSRRTSR